jgi:hypothetical protein
MSLNEANAASTSEFQPTIMLAFLSVFNVKSMKSPLML